MRALRRHHERRMKSKAVRLGRRRREANHLAICSCHACGNPRRHWNEATMAERKSSEALQYEINELQAS